MIRKAHATSTPGNSHSKGSAGPEVSALDQFVLDLKRVHRLAGEPSHRKLSRLLGERYSASTISRAFKGQTLPKWELTSALLSVLGVHPDAIENHWRRQWGGVRDQLSPLGAEGAQRHLEVQEHRPAWDGGPTRTVGEPWTTCRLCGAYVASKVLHSRWHEGIDQILAPDRPYIHSVGKARDLLAVPSRSPYLGRPGGGEG